MPTPASPTILIVDDDERSTPEPYEEWLTEYAVRRVGTGDEAIDALDEAIDVVLLDRAVPDADEETLLTTIQDQNLNCRVVLITPEDPGVEVLARGFDEYITKPVDGPGIQETVERLLNRVELAEELDRYSELVARRNELEVTYSRGELVDNEEYQDICDRIDEHEATVEARTGDLSSDIEFVGVVKEIVDDDPESTGEGDGDG